jgi:hypothetical protein
MIVFEPQETLNKACVGYYVKEGGPCLIYDYHLLVKGFVELGMILDEAVEHIDYNIIGTYIGPQSPVIMEEVGGEGEIDEQYNNRPEKRQKATQQL